MERSKYLITWIVFLHIVICADKYAMHGCNQIFYMWCISTVLSIINAIVTWFVK